MNILKKTLAFLGLDVRWIRNVRAYEQRAYEQKWAESHRIFATAKIQTVLDIGANTGQFAKMIVWVCPHLKRLHSFEPLADCQSSLRQALAGDTRHVVHPFGLGDKEETALFNHAEFSPCSSMLAPKTLLTDDHPGAGRIKQETIKLRTLDGWASENPLDAEILVKIDVQGFEDRVIVGGVQTLKKARFVIVEVPFFQLYEKQPLFHQIYLMLHELGFAYRGSIGQNIRRDGSVIEADALFENLALSATP